MSEASWKKRERECAALIGGRRFWGNSGGPVDVENDLLVGQCKEVKEMSLAELGRVFAALETAAKQRGKAPVLFLKRRAGRGHQTPILAVVNASQWFGGDGC